MLRIHYVAALILSILQLITAPQLIAQEPAARKTKLLLLAQGPDGHPAGTHEYEAGQKRLAELLAPVPNLEVRMEMVEEHWPAKADVLDDYDGVVLFLSEGAKWISAEPRRLEVLNKFAERGGGLSVFHWGMGTRDARWIPPFVQLFGACHGGEDRKYKFIKTAVRPVQKDHLITQGVSEFEIYDEFYYKLKEVRDDGKSIAKNGNSDGGKEGEADRQLITPLLEVKIDDTWQMFAWGYERKPAGRSFGFSALHVHTNWEVPAYQRVLTQGVLWTLKIDPPANWLEESPAAKDEAVKP